MTEKKERRELSKKSKLKKRINFNNIIKEQFNNNLEVLGVYIDYDTPIEFKCVVHDEAYIAKPRNVLSRKFSCHRCRKTWQRNGVEVQKCEICGSKKRTFRRKSSGKTLCRRHHEMFEKYGEFSRAVAGASNTFETFEDYAIMHIYNNKGKNVKDVKIDIEDIEKVSPYSWHLSDNKQSYIMSQSFDKPTRLHRFLVSCPEDKIVDHINRDVFDNRKKNLRICTQTNNTWNAGLRKDNTTGVRGVYFIKEQTIRPYKTEIQVNKKTISLGSFSSLEEAKKTRREAERKYYGEFAPDWGDED